MRPEMIEPPGMKNQMALNISLAVVLSAAVATVALRAAARRRGTRSLPGDELAPVTADRPASVVEQMQQVFHELHADGRNALCAVCDSQYRPA
jgi:hypothetical protein